MIFIMMAEKDENAKKPKIIRFSVDIFNHQTFYLESLL